MSLLDGRRVLVVGAGTRPWPEPDAPVGNGRAIAVVAASKATMHGGKAQASFSLMRADLPLR